MLMMLMLMITGVPSVSSHFTFPAGVSAPPSSPSLHRASVDNDPSVRITQHHLATQGWSNDAHHPHRFLSFPVQAYQSTLCVVYQNVTLIDGTLSERSYGGAASSSSSSSSSSSLSFIVSSHAEIRLSVFTSLRIRAFFLLV